MIERIKMREQGMYNEREKNAYKVFVGKAGENTPLHIFGIRNEDNIKV
jgi:hypothetical protein